MAIVTNGHQATTPTTSAAGASVELGSRAGAKRAMLMGDDSVGGTSSLKKTNSQTANNNCGHTQRTINRSNKPITSTSAVTCTDVANIHCHQQPAKSDSQVTALRPLLSRPGASSPRASRDHADLASRQSRGAESESRKCRQTPYRLEIGPLFAVLVDG